MAAWIEMISDEDADAELADVLQLARTPHGTVDNVMRVHSLRPNTMKGHVILYRAALHDDAAKPGGGRSRLVIVKRIPVTADFREQLDVPGCHLPRSLRGLPDRRHPVRPDVALSHVSTSPPVPRHGRL